jgi:predicted dehydrogenase
MDKVRWGVISTAKIGIDLVIPAVQGKEYCDVTAIASRDIGKARLVAGQLGIPKAYGSYEDLFADPEIDAIYNPLPNHMHLEWTVKALEAGKHVLSEKPSGLNTAETKEMGTVANRYPNLKLMEAFMYRFHPQWQLARQMVLEGAIGELRTIQTFFSFYNDDPTNIRNIKKYGGGAMLDIGCYAVSSARFIFGEEPNRLIGIVEYDPKMEIDRLASAILDFGRGTAEFTVSTQVEPYQRVQIVGTHGWLQIEIPFNAPTERPCKLWHHKEGDSREITMETANQYELQGEYFCKAVLDDTEVPTPWSDAIANMKVIDAVFESDRLGSWVTL